MKRYSIYIGESWGHTELEVDEDECGDWVKAEDVEAALQARSDRQLLFLKRTCAVVMILAIISLMGCSHVTKHAYKPLPVGMILVEHHYTNYQELVYACNPPFGWKEHKEACAYVSGNLCTIHLPLAWNGDPMYREHEISHCAGKIDRPAPIKPYFPPSIYD